MVDHSVHGANPTSALRGYGAHTPPQFAQPQRSRDGKSPSQAAVGDCITLHPAAAVALGILRERVLARTLIGLGLDHAGPVPNFAEVQDHEPVGAFLGRLVSAQNQLAARRAAEWPLARIRQVLHDAMHDGALETLELLASEAEPLPEAAAVVAEVLAEFGRRVAIWLAADGAPADG